MQPDTARQNLRHMLWKRGVSLADASLALGRNKTYLQQYLARGMPRVLSHQDSARLGEILDCDPEILRHAEIPPPKPRKKKNPRTGSRSPAPGMAVIPEMEVEAAAGPGAIAEEFAQERASWQIPESMIRHEGHARPEDLRILMVRGESMEPEMREGDRLLVDTGRRRPDTGELFVLWDGNGLVVKRVEAIRGSEPPRLRLLSANPGYEPYTCLVEDAHIVGKVVWTLKRM